MRKGKGIFAGSVNSKVLNTAFSGILLILLLVSAKTAHAFILPDTGQTTCYDSSGDVIACPSTGQDGAYGINPMSYTDNGDGTVTDNNTGLMWQQQDDGNDYNWYQASGTYDETYDPLSQNVCGSLNLGGHTDWRLPTKRELMSIVDYAIFLPALAPIFGGSSLFYWSSTDIPVSPPIYAQLVDFAFGYVGGMYDKSGSYLVRCVRAGQTETASFVDNGNGTVTDNTTRLVWQQGETGLMSWQAALDYCNGLTLAGNSDWRLPNNEELESITDETAFAPAIDATYFPNASSLVPYWSSTTADFAPYLAWCQYLGNGTISPDKNKDDKMYVRCVRGGQPAPSKIGVFGNGYWYLDSNVNWQWDGTPADTLGIFGVGLTGAVPVAGDWNGDGTSKIGVYIGGTWYLDMNGNGQWDGVPPDAMYSFGAGLPDAIPVAGDWNGGGTSKIGIYSDGVWYLDANGNGQWDGVAGGDTIAYFGVGLTGAVPVTGDWNGGGKTKIGVYQNGYWYLDTNGNGQWDGEATDQFAIFGIGLTNAVPVTGDWNGDGIAEIGIYHQGYWYLDMNGNWQWDGEPADQFGVFGVGLTGAVPVPGKW
jgi:Protein of unknown function (DUF1566)